MKYPIEHSLPGALENLLDNELDPNNQTQTRCMRLFNADDCNEWSRRVGSVLWVWQRQTLVQALGGLILSLKRLEIREVLQHGLEITHPCGKLLV